MKIYNVFYDEEGTLEKTTDLEGLIDFANYRLEVAKECGTDEDLAECVETKYQALLVLEQDGYSVKEVEV